MAGALWRPQGFCRHQEKPLTAIQDSGHANIGKFKLRVVRFSASAATPEGKIYGRTFGSPLGHSSVVSL